jgi:hypothetical protein
MVMLNHLGMGIDGKLFSTAQDSVDKLKDPFLAINRMQRELRRIIAQEARLDDEDQKHAKSPVDEDDEDCRDDAVETIDLALMAARRASRFDDLDLSQHFTMAMIDRLSKGVAGLLTGAAHLSIERLNDPFLAINRMQRELRRIVALAEQLDEDDAERAKRLAAEAAEKARAARAAEEYRLAAIESEKEEAKKAAIHQAVTDAARDAWGDDDADFDPDADENEDRLSLVEQLDDLFDDYDTYEDYDRDPVEIVAKMCAELGLKPEADLLVEAEADGDPKVAEQAIALELARGYLDRAGWAVEPAPVQDGHGPPDG